MPDNVNSTKQYEEDLLKEFSEKQEPHDLSEPVSMDMGGNVYGRQEEHEPVKDLGKVKNPGVRPNSMSREELDNDPEIQRMNSLVNFIRVPVEMFPSQGRFYADDFNVYIRSCRVGEIREYSMMDESNPNDIIDKMNYMLASCTKVSFGNMPGSYKDILDHDRFYLIKRIQELTFKNGETVINIPVPDGACKTPGCKPQTEVKLTSDMLERPEPDPQLEKYYDSVNKCFSIKTKHYGTIQLAPPTIGVTTIVRDWAIDRTQNQKRWDQALVQIIPFFQRDWRQFKDRDVFNLATEFENWDATKFTLIYRMIEKINATVGMSPNIHVRCESCGGDMEIPVMFQTTSDDGQEVRGGFKSLFVPTISDQSDELL